MEKELLLLLALLRPVSEVGHQDEILVHALQEAVPVRLRVDDGRLVVGLLAADRLVRGLVLLVPAAGGAVQDAERVVIMQSVMS